MGGWAIPRALRPLLIGSARPFALALGTGLRAAARAGGRAAQMPHDPDKILVVAIHYLGDCVLTTPLLQALAQRFANARIDIWCRNRSADYFRSIWQRGEIIASDLAASDRTRERSASFSRAGAHLGRLRRERYDLAVDASGTPATTLALFATNAAFNTGQSEQGLGGLLDLAAPMEARGEHLLMRRHQLAKALGIESLHTWPPNLRALLSGGDESSAERARDLSRKVVLYLGAGWRDKLWPPEHFGALSRALSSDSTLTPVLVAGPGERALLDRARSTAEPIAIQTIVTHGFADLLAAIVDARIVVAADCGPGHVAAALGLPLLSLFGPTDMALCGPIGKQVRMIAAPDRIMASLSPEKVESTLHEMLRG